MELELLEKGILYRYDKKIINLLDEIISDIELNTSDDICSICYNFLSENLNVTTTICNHKFCSNCMVNIQYCPLCRQKLSENKNNMTNLFLNSREFLKFKNISLNNIEQQTLNNNIEQQIVNNIIAEQTINNIIEQEILGSYIGWRILDDNIEQQTVNNNIEQETVNISFSDELDNNLNNVFNYITNFFYETTFFSEIKKMLYITIFIIIMFFPVLITYCFVFIYTCIRYSINKLL